jgi:hypothetical protein
MQPLANKPITATPQRAQYLLIDPDAIMLLLAFLG